MGCSFFYMVLVFFAYIKIFLGMASSLARILSSSCGLSRLSLSLTTLRDHDAAVHGEYQHSSTKYRYLRMR
jgi:hypothetical protein